jgi:hypothetical protein
MKAEEFRIGNITEYGTIHQLQNLYFALTGIELNYEKLD